MKKYLAIILAIPFLSAFIINFYGINLFELPKQTFIAIFIALFIIFFSLFFLSKEKTKIVYHKGIFIMITLWILTLFLSSYFGEAPQKSFYGDYIRQGGVISHFIYIFYFLIVLNTLKTKKEIQKFLLTIFIISTFIGVHAILQKFNLLLFFSIQDLEKVDFLGRSFASFGNPNILGQFLLFPIFIGIYFLFNKKSILKNKKIVSLIPLLILIIALIFTENRASILALIASGIALIFLSEKINSRIKILISLLLLSIFIAFVFTFTPSLRSLGSRIFLWDIANKSFIENPIIGSGLENYDSSFQKFVQDDYFKLEPLFHTADRAHNEFLDIQSSMGIIGFSIYISAIMYLIIIFLIRKKKDPLEKTMFSALLAILISNLFSFSLTLNFINFYTILALLCLLLMPTREINLKLNSKSIAIIPVLLISSSILSLIYIKNLSADIHFKSAQSNSKTPYLSLIQATKLNPNQSQIYYYLAHFLNKNAVDYKDALEKAGQFENKGVNFLINKALLEKNKNPQIALKTLEKAEIIAPKNNNIRLIKAEIFYENEKYFSCTKELEKIMKIAPKYAFYSPEDIRKDQVSYNSFLRNNPDFHKISKMLSDSYEKLKLTP